MKAGGNRDDRGWDGWHHQLKNNGMGCYFLLQGNLPDPGIEPISLVSLAFAGGFFTTSTTSEAPGIIGVTLVYNII